MGLGGCYTCIKYLLVVFNILFWLVGIVGVVFSVWMLVDPTFSVSLTQESTDYLISLCIILAGSILLVIVATFGICGACQEKQCGLLTFFCLLLIIVVAEVATGVWAYVNRDSLQESVKTAVQITVEKEYYSNDNRRLLFDTFQQRMECCGAKDPSDWTRNHHTNLKVSSDPPVHSIPVSCCRSEVSLDACSRAIEKATKTIDTAVIYDKGCYPLIMDKLKENAYVIMGVGIAVLVVQLLGLIFALMLAYAVGRSNRYKA